MGCTREAAGDFPLTAKPSRGAAPGATLLMSALKLSNSLSACLWYIADILAASIKLTAISS